MRMIEHTSLFKRDFKRESKGQYKAIVTGTEFRLLIQALANDLPMPAKLRDHALTGEWKDHRDCHVRPDLVLIYRKPNNQALQLVRLGSHSELSL